MAKLPRSAWEPSAAGSTALALVEWAKSVPASERTSEDYLKTTQIAGDLAGLLPAEAAAGVRKTLRDLGVAVFVIKTVREQLRYDTPRLVVEAGKPFEIIFVNDDVMPHNLLVVKPGSKAEIGLLTATMPPTPDAEGRAYVPKSEKVLAATKLLEPDQRATLKLTAPGEPGDYEYVCTFPGHWMIMNGVLVVTRDVEAYLREHPTLAP
jgi:azurin